MNKTPLPVIRIFYSAGVSLVLIFSFLVASTRLRAQHHHESNPALPHVIENVDPQPLLAQALRVGEALTFIGSAGLDS
jgi:hypothetical protein